MTGVYPNALQLSQKTTANIGPKVKLKNLTGSKNDGSMDVRKKVDRKPFSLEGLLRGRGGGA